MDEKWLSVKKKRKTSKEGKGFSACHLCEPILLTYVSVVESIKKNIVHSINLVRVCLTES